jgi:hypothetical protein
MLWLPKVQPSSGTAALIGPPSLSRLFTRSRNCFSVSRARRKQERRPDSFDLPHCLVRCRPSIVDDRFKDHEACVKTKIGTTIEKPSLACRPCRRNRLAMRTHGRMKSAHPRRGSQIGYALFLSRAVAAAL